jgi:predicted ATPase/class 3 adenylate cyclase
MSVTPSGTVTFLFTDIEGSTKLAQEYLDRWEDLRAHHHAILQSTCEANQGYIFQIIGDAFCVAFHTAKDALVSAIESQYKLLTESRNGAPIKVRMGMHTGAAEWNGQDYRGYLTLAKVQRVMSVAYGGQVLLSNASAELLHSELPKGITLRDIKEHRLKGLPDPEHLWQVVAPELQQDFPPLQSLKEIPNNLPVQLTSFVGREREVEQVKKRLERNRLVTLTGSGGVGKTRLSIQVASELVGEYPNGVWLVELAPVTDPSLVTQTICTALNVTLQGNTPALNVLTDYLKQKKILLVVDNCEHLIDACAQLCETLLHMCPELRILASSREALGIDGENAYRVPSLSLANPKDKLQTIRESEAVKLFMERACAMLPEFEMTEVNAPVIAQICQRLDGIALAVELAASRVKLLKVEQIAARLDDAFRLLTGGSRTALPRQQTLRALIDWSYNLLSEEERTALRYFSVFAGGWTLEGAEAVHNHSNILDLLTHLVDKSLVAVDLEHGQEPRYYLLETIRQYAREKLAEAGETSFIRDRHLAYFLAVAKRAEPEVQGAQQLLWFDRLEIEIDNLRAALAWALERGENGAELGLELASSLWWFWFQRHSEESHWLEKALMATKASADPVRRANAWARLSAGRFFYEAAAEEALALGRRLGPAGRESVALALLYKGAWAVYQADYAQANVLTEESVRLFRELGYRWGICEALTWLGMSLIFMGEHQRAIPPLEESLSLARQARDGNEIAFALWGLGRAAMARSDYAQASKLITEGLAVYKELKLDGGVRFLLGDLGKAALGLGDHQLAVSHYKEALTINWDWGNERRIAEGLEQLASAVMYGHVRKAVQLLGTAQALRESCSAPIFPYQVADYERTLTLLRAQLDESTFASYWAEGRAMNVNQVVKEALRESYE